MRPVLSTFLSGLGASVAVSGLCYLLDPEGDMHIGPWIYLVLCVLLVLCHLFGVCVAMFFDLCLREGTIQRSVALVLSFIAILVSNVAGFVGVVLAVFGHFVWDASITWLVPSMVVGVIASATFVCRYRNRAA